MHRQHTVFFFAQFTEAFFTDLYIMNYLKASFILISTLQEKLYMTYTLFYFHAGLWYIPATYSLSEASFFF